jgi:hypothetical protein
MRVRDHGLPATLATFMAEVTCHLRVRDPKFRRAAVTTRVSPNYGRSRVERSGTRSSKPSENASRGVWGILSSAGASMPNDSIEEFLAEELGT